VADDWDAPTSEYTGDVRLGNRTECVGLRGPEDVYVLSGAVDGELAVRDAEYVFTDVPATSTPGVDGADVEATVAGDVADGYVEDVADDAVVAGAEDVFVAFDGASTLSTAGVEQVFHDAAAAPTRPPGEYDVSVDGWNHSREVRDPRTGVAVVGAKNEVTVRAAAHDLTVYVAGWDNEVRVEGKNAGVTAYFVGRDNRVSAGPFLSVTTAAESGYDNVATADPVPPEAVVQTTKEEAHRDAFIGRHRLTWQEPATDKEWCPNCGADADAVVVRRQRDATFLFGVPVRTHDDGGRSYECEQCSPHLLEDVSLSEAERRSALR
jgi:hypothetical protein